MEEQIKYVLRRRTNRFLTKGTPRFEGKLLPWVLLREANCDTRGNTRNSIPKINIHFMWIHDSYVFLHWKWGHNGKPKLSSTSKNPRLSQKQKTPSKKFHIDISPSWFLNKIHNIDRNGGWVEYVTFEQLSGISVSNRHNLMLRRSVYFIYIRAIYNIYGEPEPECGIFYHGNWNYTYLHRLMEKKHSEYVVISILHY